MGATRRHQARLGERTRTMARLVGVACPGGGLTYGDEGTSPERLRKARGVPARLHAELRAGKPRALGLPTMRLDSDEKGTTKESAIMRTDRKTGLRGLTSIEVEALPLPDSISVIEWPDSLPKVVHGFVTKPAHAATRITDVITGAEVEGRAVELQTPEGRQLLWLDHPELAELWAAKKGAPVVVHCLGERIGLEVARAFDVVVGEPDPGPGAKPETQPASLHDAAREAMKNHAPPNTELDEAIERAEALLQRQRKVG